MNSRLTAITMALVFAAGGAVAGDSTTFNVGDEVGRNSVTFTSEAPLEDIVGTTNQITGFLEFDPEHPDRGGKGRLVVPVASLDTGIPMRDEHLRSAGWLDAGAHPDIVLTIDKVKDTDEVKRGDGFVTYDVVAVGTFSLKGQDRDVEVPARVTYLAESEKTQALMPGDLLAVRASLTVTLADFGVTGPAGKNIIGAKVGETVTVEVSFRASNASS